MIRAISFLMVLVPFVLSSQSIGIGTTTPLSKLDILHTGDGAELLRFSTDRAWVFKQRDAGVNARLSLQSTVNFKTFEIVASDGINRAADFFTASTGSIVSLVPDGGKVGILTDNPQQPLHVAGDVWIGGAGDAYDFEAEAMLIQGRSGAWNIGVQNEPTESTSDFFIGLTGMEDGIFHIQRDGNIGVGTTTPASKLDVQGKLRVADDSATATSGMIRWNEDTEDFEGYNGSVWLSLTSGKQSTSWPVVDHNGPGKLLDYQKLNFPLPAGSFSNRSMAMSNDFAVIGVPDVRKAVVYMFDGTQWVFDQIIAPTDSSNAEGFGRSVSVHGNWILVGARQGKVSGIKKGKCYLFQNVSDVWTQEQILTDPTGVAGDQFGFSVSIFINDLVIGSPFSDPDSTDQGKLIFFHQSGGTWTYTGEYVDGSGNEYDYLGYSVSLSAFYCVAGAPAGDIDGLPAADVGKAYMLKRVFNTEFWSFNTFLPTAQGWGEEGVGIEVAISDNQALVGFYGPGTGVAHFVFEETAGIWNFEFTNLDYIGYQAFLSNERLLFCDEFAENCGACTGTPSSVGTFIVTESGPGLNLLRKRINHDLSISGFAQACSINSDGRIAILADDCIFFTRIVEP